MPSSAVYLSYDDAGAVIDWLEAVGFHVTQRIPGEDGRVMHCEAVRGDLVVMVASDDARYRVPELLGNSTGVGVYLVTDDVEGLYRTAVDAGGVSVHPPEDTGWGSRPARVLDPGGREWSFGSYRPGEAGGSA